MVALLGATMAVTLADVTTDFAHCREVFERYGCFVVDDAIESAAMLDELEAAARRVAARGQSGSDAYSLEVAENTAEGTQINALIAPEYGEPVFQRMMSSEALGRYADLLLPPPVRFWFCAMWCLNDTQEANGTYDSSWHLCVPPLPCPPRTPSHR